MDQRTDKASCRDARTHLKKEEEEDEDGDENDEDEDEDEGEAEESKVEGKEPRVLRSRVRSGRAS